MTEFLKADLCVIGAGAAGLGVAIAASAFGASVILVEKSKTGGARLNGGAVPAAALAAAAKRAQAMCGAGPFGIAGVEPEVNFGRVNRHLDAVVDAVGKNDTEARLAALGVKVIHAAAYFADRRTIIAGEQAVRARRFVIATGSEPVVPSVPGLDGTPYLTSETVFALTRRPRHLVVLGGDAAGLSLAQSFRRLGSFVTVIEPQTALADFDKEARAIAVEAIRAEGVDLREGTKVTSAARHGAHGVRIQLETGTDTETIDASHLLIAGPRRPATTDLRLKNARITRKGDGIRVNARLRTSNRRVFAIGDVVDGTGSLVLATFQAGLLVRESLFGLVSDAKRGLLPAVAWTDPGIAQIGLDETAARRRHRSIRILRWPFSESEQAQATRNARGFVKIVTDRKGRILGVVIAGANAQEQVAFWTLAIARRLTVADVIDTAFASPTFAEIGKRAAMSYFAPAARSPRLRRLVRMRRLFG